MMNINPTQAIRNVWLVELFENNADGLTLQEIIEEYHYRPPQLVNNVNPSQVSERTIHNWFKEIEENFHIKISCGRGNKTYHIDNDDYWEMRIGQSDLTGHLNLLITDFAEDDDADGLKILWESNLDRLHRASGL